MKIVISSLCTKTGRKITMFYDYFDELCNHKGISANKACLEMGLSRAVAAKWKSTNTNPRMSTLVKISEYFDISIDAILAREIPGKTTQTTQTIQTLSKNEQELIYYFRLLNKNGIELVLDYAKNISENTKYIKSDSARAAKMA